MLSDFFKWLIFIVYLGIIAINNIRKILHITTYIFASDLITTRCTCFLTRYLQTLLLYLLIHNIVCFSTPYFRHNVFHCQCNINSMFFVLGDITQKGYEKKRTRLLSPYVPKQNTSKYTYFTLNNAALHPTWYFKHDERYGSVKITEHVP